MLAADLRMRLYPYICGIANKNNFKIMAVNGTDDHIHVLLSLRPDLSVFKAVQLIKGGSSKWLHDNFPTQKLFQWQEGYGVFSVSVSQIDNVKQYIANQEQHHKKMNFQEEYREFLKRNNVHFDEKYLFQ